MCLCYWPCKFATRVGRGPLCDITSCLPGLILTYSIGYTEGKSFKLQHLRILQFCTSLAVYSVKKIVQKHGDIWANWVIFDKLP